jgi:hypothetical protein
MLIGWKVEPILARELSLFITLLLTPVAILSLAATQAWIVILYISVQLSGLAGRGQIKTRC